MKSLRTAQAAAVLVLAIAAGTSQARTEESALAYCTRGALLTSTIADARDEGMPLPEVMNKLKEHDLPEFFKIADAIYSHPAIKNDEAAIYYMEGCMKGKAI